LDNPNDSEEDSTADDESDIDQNTVIEDQECPEE